MKFLKTLTTLVIVQTLYSPAGLAQDKCGDIISKIVTTKFSASNENERATLIFNTCSMSFEEHKKAYGNKASANFQALSGKREYSSSSYDQFKQESCTNLSTDKARSAQQYAFQQGPDSEGVRAWRECMLNREGLTCWVQPSGAIGSVSLVINWRSDLTTLPKVTESFLSSGSQSSAAGAVPGKLLPIGAILPRGSKAIEITKPPRGALDASLSVEVDGQGRSCNVFVSAPLQPVVVRTIPLSQPPQKYGDQGGICDASISFANTSSDKKQIEVRARAAARSKGNGSVEVTATVTGQPPCKSGVRGSINMETAVQCKMVIEANSTVTAKAVQGNQNADCVTTRVEIWQ